MQAFMSCPAYHLKPRTRTDSRSPRATLESIRRAGLHRCARRPGKNEQCFAVLTALDPGRGTHVTFSPVGRATVGEGKAVAMPGADHVALGNFRVVQGAAPMGAEHRMCGEAGFGLHHAIVPSLAGNLQG